ncbi:MAG: TonB family protein [Novosphingobium sp.]|uniref:energy transducer TonB n=1 Tax=Novosphingobium sp. TaxID=1874826 RepID=UPI0032BAA489
MAYADQEMSGNRIAAFVLVALLHLALGYALVTGLAYEGFKAVVKKVTTVDIKKDEPKKEEKPPPPKKDVTPPPIVVPPPRINLSPPQTNIQTVTSAAPVRPTQTFEPLATATAVATKEPPKAPPVQGKPKGNPGGWVTNDDYPTRAMREERQGTTGFRLTYGADGRPTSCDITSSSGSPDLDSTACSLLMRRARFVPGMEDGRPTGGSWSSRFRWVIPEE